MRVFLTGASGFIGSHVARLALGQGHEVTALMRPESGSSRLEDVRGRLRIVHGDLRDSADLEPPLTAAVPDVCVHLAWYAEPGHYLRAHENVDCLTGSFSLVQLLHRIGCRRLVIAGTSLEYAKSPRAVDETSPVHPASLYAAAKHALFLTASNFDAGDGWSVAAARIFCVYGPREDPRRLVPFVITKLLAGERCELSSGEQIRDYSHVEDVAGALWAVAKSSVVGPINIGSSHAVSVAAIARQIGELVGRPELIVHGARSPSPDEPPFIVAKTDRLRTEVGFSPRYDLASGLSHTLAWWREQHSR